VVLAKVVLALLGLTQNAREERLRQVRQGTKRRKGDDSMPKKPTGNPIGRPPKNIDQKTFENLCKIQCTEREIAGIFECDIDTVNNWCKRTYNTTFSDTYKMFSDQGKASLRRLQMKLAEKNAGMAIFLGKQYLGQTDRVEQTVMEVEDLSSLAEMLRDDAPAESEGEKTDNE